MYVCETLRYVCKRHYIARCAERFIGEGQDPTVITKSYLTNNLKEFANWLEDI